MGQIKEVAVNAGDLGISTSGKELLQVLKELAEAMDIGQEDDICAMCEHNSTCTIKNNFPDIDTDATESLLKWFDDNAPVEFVEGDEDDRELPPEEFNEYIAHAESKSRGTIPEFAAFLGTDLFNKFMHNSSVIDFSSSAPEKYISSAFIWCLSEEGNEFWNAADTMWRNYCEATNTKLTTATKTELDDVLDSRSVYGSFREKAEFIQSGKMAIRDAPMFELISCAEQEALDNIIQKMGRILFGEFHKDNWTAIQTYAALVVLND